MAGASLTDDPGLLRTLMQRRVTVVALVVFLLVLAAAVLAPWISPADPAKMSVRARLSEPFGDYFLGADAFGRDVLSRLLFAGRVSLTIGLGVATVSTLAGLVIGLAAGFFRRLDAPLSRLIDAMMAFPDILLAIALVSIFGGSIFNVILALSIVYTPRIARIVRAATLVIRELPFVEAARALGSGNGAIIFWHVLPNIVSPVTVQATFIFAYAMLAEAGLSFLGVGVDPKIPTWGTMVNEGRQYIDQALFLIFLPGVAISLAVLSLQLIGDGLRDALDPRLSKDL
jgi:peptide/nickel transport system permease protein